MAQPAAKLSIMDQATANESSDAFGFHYARVSHVREIHSSQDLLEIVLGKSFMHAECPTWRKSENISATHWLIWDIDAHYCVKDLAEKLETAGYRYWLVSSRNHQKEKVDSQGHIKPACDRFRVILPLENSITKKEDYSFTSKSLCKELGLNPDLLDPASFSISGRWQPGLELLAHRDLGRLVKDKVAPLPRPRPATTSSCDGKGRLRKRTLNFLQGQLTKGWHYDLLFACADLKSALYTKEEAICELEKATLGKGLDRHHDLYQIDYVYHRSSFQLDYLPPRSDQDRD